MTRFTFRFVRRCGAPPARVYRVLADVPRWHTWMPAISAAEFERIGDIDPQGAGAIRRLTSLGMTIAREEILEAWPPHYQRYAILSRGPVRDYVGAVRIEPDGEGSVIRWESSFAPLIPGTGKLARFALRRTVMQIASSLAKAAERSDAADVGHQAT
jgi:hypothetical protein